MTTLKTCTKCGQAKDLSCFYKSKVLKSGYRSRCIACELDGAAEKSRAWYAANKDVAKATREKYAAENKDRLKAIAKKWVDENRARSNAIKQKHRDANKEQINARARAAEKADPSKRATARKKWDEKNPESRRAVTRNRRARIAGAGGRVSSAQIGLLLISQSHCCAVCKCDLLQSGHHIDHIEPIARGGQNTIENMQALCPPCNRTKSAKDPIKFMQSMGYLL